MKMDPGSNYSITEAIAAQELTAAAHNGAAVDHADAPSVSFLISAGTIGSSGTVDAKVQYSDDGSTWTDEPSSPDIGNDTAITQITEAGSARLDVPNPRGRYSRVVVTVGTAACVVGVVSVAGPLRSVSV